jgi:carbonic anhydrase
MIKKTLIITGFNEKVLQSIPEISQKATEELLIFNSLGEVISQPYGCLVRDIILAINFENVVEIYVIGDENRSSFSEEELLSRLEKSGVTKQAIETLDYINSVGDSTINWLKGPQVTRDKIKRNVDIIKRHPLIPRSLPVKGFIVNTETNEIDLIS